MKWETFKRAFKGGGERGTSLLEVLIALLIFLFLMIGVLQMFTLAFLVNKGAGARTEMTYKAQQVVENMRFLNYLYHLDVTNKSKLPTDMQAWFPLTDGASYDLSTFSSSQLSTSYWGPSKSDVVEGINPRYAVALKVTDAGGYWNLVVTVRANTATGVVPYIHGVGQRKVIDYAAQMPK